MSRNYDNWDRLVGAVLRRELIWQLCHENSRTPSLRSSVSSDNDFSCSFRLSSFSDESFKPAQFLPFQILSQIKSSIARPETEDEPGRLVVLEGSPFAFGLEELLMAPSMVLGEEMRNFRTTYMVRFRKDAIFVAKRLRRGHYTNTIFEQRLKIMQDIEHENIVKLRAYYLSQDESIGVYDYFPQGSLYTMLHGKKDENRVQLDWQTRVSIAVGAARGVVHIHKQWSRRLSHGNIRASNIFLNSQNFGCMADINLSTVEISRYHAPEVSITGEMSQASDVYSLGVILIELLSGRSPLHTRSHKTFPDWALCNARDDWAALVFDKGLLKNPVVKQGMWEMFSLAMSCVVKEPEKRPNMKNVVETLEFVYTKYCVW